MWLRCSLDCLPSTMNRWGRKRWQVIHTLNAVSLAVTVDLFYLEKMERSDTSDAIAIHQFKWWLGVTLQFGLAEVIETPVWHAKCRQEGRTRLLFPSASSIGRVQNTKYKMRPSVMYISPWKVDYNGATVTVTLNQSLRDALFITIQSTGTWAQCVSSRD